MTFLKYDTYKMPKAGNSPEEYEDGFSVKEINEEEIRFAIADGATESSFSGIWAALLCEGYTESIPIASLKERWLARVDALELPWYAREKAEQGAWAAYLGASFFSGKSNRLEIQAYGDCNIFQIREGSLLKAFPLTVSSEFGSTPALLSSLDQKQESLDDFQNFQNIDYHWQEGDRFLLMTDALAAWFLNEIESKGDGFNRIFALNNQEEFEKLVAEEREKRDPEKGPRLKNDDVTLIKIDTKK
ncbi:MAG: hypothetical protein R3C24_00210 [Cyanobacteriota/Melainabacteria group bacterium]